MKSRSSTPWRAKPGKTGCGCTCVGGNACDCANHDHAQHICRHATCICHTPETYGMIRVGGVYRRLEAVTWPGLPGANP